METDKPGVECGSRFDGGGGLSAISSIDVLQELWQDRPAQQLPAVGSDAGDKTEDSDVEPTSEYVALGHVHC